MKNLIDWLNNPPTDGPTSIVLLRLMAGGGFFGEGVLKFVYTNQGVGRFTKLGFPPPHFTATADGWFEISGGTLLPSGFGSGLMVLPFIIGMLVRLDPTRILAY